MTDEGAPAPLHWRPRSFLLWGAGAACWAVGIVAIAPALIFLGLPLLLAPIAAAVFGSGARPVASLAWQAEGEGRAVDVRGAVEVAPPTDPDDLELTFDRPGALREREPPRIVRDGPFLRFSLAWEAPEPTITVIPGPTLVWRDPAGLVERDVPLAPSPLEVERYPPELVRIGSARLERTIALPGETRARRLGASGEFFGLRSAAPAEPPRRINWRASARAGRWMANEFQVERTGDVLLLLDARPTALGYRRDSAALALSAAAAYGIAESFLREKARVGLGVFGEFLSAVPLSGGRIQGIRIRRALLGARVSAQAGPPERCAIALGRYFRPGVTTILLSTLTDDDPREMVAFLRRRGYPVMVLSPSPLPAPDPARASDLAERIARLARRSRIARVWEEAPVIDWDDAWSLAGLARLLGRPPERRRA